MHEHYYNDTVYYRTNDFVKDRPTLVFVHGISGSSSAWIDYEEAFKDDYNILSYDIRGHGKSKKPRQRALYTTEAYAEELHEIINHAGIEQAVFIAHSFATLFLMEFMERYPERVSACALLSPCYKVNSSLLSHVGKPILTFGAFLFELLPFSEAPREHIDYSKYPNSTDWSIMRTWADLTNTTLHVYCYASSDTFRFDKTTSLPKLAAPTLLMHGRKDTIFPIQNSIDMAHMMPNAELEIIDDIDHIVVLNRLARVRDRIRTFLTTHRAEL